MPNRLLKIAEVAERLGVSSSHLYKLIRSGKFPVPVVRDLGDMRVSEKALDQWIETAGRVEVRDRPKVQEPRRRRAAPVRPRGDVIVPFPE